MTERAYPYGMTAEQIKDTEALIEREFPDLWRVCYPRTYDEPKCGTYYSPKDPARQIAGVALKVEKGFVGESEKYEFAAFSHLAKFRVPTFWLSPDMATAIRQTQPPGEIEWYDMPMPSEACVFMLPKGTLVHKQDGDVRFIAYARLRAGDPHVSKLIPGMPYGSINGGMILLAFTEQGYLTHWNIPLSGYNARITLPDLDEKMMEYGATGNHSTGVFFLPQPEMALEDNLLGLEVAHMIFGTVILMNDRPDLITRGGLRKKVPGKSGNDVREFWTPNILGEFYRIRRIADPQGGSHASPRFHWVRGFYRMTAHGEGRSLRRRDWIEPFMRGLG